MIKKVLQTIKRYDMIKPGDRVIIGLSGGADSVFLTHALHELKNELLIELCAMHINHGLRGNESVRDEEFSKVLCISLSIPFDARRVDVKHEAARLKISVEEAGRIIRYEALNKASCDKIAVAHNLNDLAETVILNLCRGSGLLGVCGIPPVNHNIIRPLIDIKRSEIEEYLKERNILYMEDITNKSLDYTRNIIRHKVLPVLTGGVNKNTADNIRQFAAIARDEDDYLQSIAVKALNDCGITNSIDISKFNGYPNVIKARVIRYALKNYAGLKGVNHKNIEDILNLTQKGSGRSVNLPGGVTARISFGVLSFTHAAAVSDFCYELSLDQSVYIKELGIYARITLDNKEGGVPFLIEKNAKIQARARKPKDVIYFKSINGHKKLKDFFIEHKIPRFLRDNALIIACGHEVLRILYGDMDILTDTPPNTDADGRVMVYNIVG